MIARLHSIKKNGMNAIVYLDLENISILMHNKYGQDLQKMGFFNVIKKKMCESGFNLIDFIVYSNFERPKEQTYLRSMGLQTRQSSVHGKNCSDLELTVEALKTLYTNQNINTFIIISSDRDIIPLLKAIKYENKSTYVISTRIGFNSVVAEYADVHEYIEDIFELTNIEAIKKEESTITFDLSPITQVAIERAKEVSRHFYTSNIYLKAKTIGEQISLTGYINVLTRVIGRSANDLLNDFKIAHQLNYISIYKENQRLYLREGENKKECQLN